ncbi:FtsW/RodA/SpoVE family cell cycle protein, partial [Bacillus velezensis]
MGSETRIETTFQEFNRVLGGGIVLGSLVLIGGDPGIGKSTMLLQVSSQLAKKDHKVLYVSGEESQKQIKLRAERLGIATKNLFVLSETDLSYIARFMDEMAPDFVVIDSIQTIYLNEVTSAPGSVSQVRECTSELMKIFMIIILGTIISKHNETYSVRGKKEDLFLLIKIMGISLPPLLLIAKEPDLGNTMVMCAIIATMILVSGIRWRYILALVGITVALGSFMVYLFLFHFEFFTAHVLQEYQLNRFYGWLAPYEYPTQGYQLTQALMAAGSGMLTGKGFHNGEAYFPEPHTDFIFTVICEQYGFIGASVVISFFFLLIYRMIH